MDNFNIFFIFSFLLFLIEKKAMPTKSNCKCDGGYVMN